ncbi:cob(I)yrinic acid a,c-diamide adenosyltransferase, partial [Candidatus Sumerlaeota bacterium]|nr:cob(I)yrinic acid a,c-diamide adenosyltransferase [Candidatus Sumerlaeota bacterium]
MTKSSAKKAKKRSPPRRKRRALRITRVYTRTGDAGTTSLVGGQVVRKDDPRIEAYGTIDELSVCVGHARDIIGQTSQASAEQARGEPSKKKPEQTSPERLRRLNARALAEMEEHLRYLQNLLFTLGGDLATRFEDRWDAMPLIAKKDTAYLERLIDAINSGLAPLTDFVLPSGGDLPLALHTCRVVCRRAERRLQTLAQREEIGPHVMPFVNRLSDLFFVMARWAVAQQLERGKGQA